MKTQVNEDLIAPLPAPVQRSLRRSGVVGREIPRSVVVRQKGRLRSAPHSNWLAFTASETYDVAEPGFEWRAALKKGPVTVGRATDSLHAARGKMNVKLLGLLTVLDLTGPELDQGTLLRWLNETMWFPAVWATPLIAWRAVDENTAIGSVTAGATNVEAAFHFDDTGRLVDFRADRYRQVKDGFELRPWATPLYEHARFNGLELPSRGGGVWMLDDEEFEYVQIHVLDITYP